LAIAYVLVNVETGAENEILDKLASIDEIKEVYFVYGVYDIIVKIEAENVDKIKEIVTWKIRRLDKVRSTVTMVTMGKN